MEASSSMCKAIEETSVKTEECAREPHDPVTRASNPAFDALDQTRTAATDAGLADRLVELSSGRDLPAVRLLLVTLTSLTAWLLLTRCWRPLASTVARPLAAVGTRGTTVLAGQVLLLVLLAAVVPGVPG